MKRGASSSASLPRTRLMESAVVYTQSGLHIQTWEAWLQLHHGHRSHAEERQKQEGSETPRNSHPDTFRPKPECCADMETGRSGGLIQSRFGGSSETSLCPSPAPDPHTPALWSAFHRLSRYLKICGQSPEAALPFIMCFHRKNLFPALSSQK